MTDDHAKEQAEAQYDSIIELLESGDSDAITEDALEVAVRSYWTDPASKLEPSEFMILLCTGGPAVRIVGDLDEYFQPCNARLEYQDWGTQWTTWHPTTSDTLCQYAAYFSFGE